MTILNYYLFTTIHWMPRQPIPIQLDSLTYKSSTAIALHDLRNDWVDNMYLLWGASYYLQKKFDSAYLMFQFINYAFSPKEKDGTLKTIGSGRDGNSAYSVSTKRKKTACHAVSFPSHPAAMMLSSGKSEIHWHKMIWQKRPA